MRLRLALLAALVAAFLAAIYGTARAQVETADPLPVTAPAPTPPFDPAILERIRAAIVARIADDAAGDD